MIDAATRNYYTLGCWSYLRVVSDLSLAFANTKHRKRKKRIRTSAERHVGLIVPKMKREEK